MGGEAGRAPSGGLRSCACSRTGWGRHHHHHHQNTFYPKTTHYYHEEKDQNTFCPKTTHYYHKAKTKTHLVQTRSTINMKKKIKIHLPKDDSLLTMKKKTKISKLKMIITTQVSGSNIEPINPLSATKHILYSQPNSHLFIVNLDIPRFIGTHSFELSPQRPNNDHPPFSAHANT